MEQVTLNQWFLFQSSLSYLHTSTLQHTAELQLLCIFVSESRIKVVDYTVTK